MPLSSRFARVRVRVAHRDYWLAEPRAEEWLLIEWPQGENEPTKYWLSTLPGDITFRRLVDIAKLRWRIERDYHCPPSALVGQIRQIEEGSVSGSS